MGCAAVDNLVCSVTTGSGELRADDAVRERARADGVRAVGGIRAVVGIDVIARRQPRRPSTATAISLVDLLDGTWSGMGPRRSGSTFTGMRQ